MNRMYVVQLGPGCWLGPGRSQRERPEDARRFASRDEAVDAMKTIGQHGFVLPLVTELLRELEDVRLELGRAEGELKAMSDGWAQLASQARDLFGL